jgi:hypothetical protein
VSRSCGTLPWSIAAKAAAATRPLASVGSSLEISVVGTLGVSVENAAKPIKPPKAMIMSAPNANGGRTRTVKSPPSSLPNVPPTRGHRLA